MLVVPPGSRDLDRFREALENGARLQDQPKRPIVREPDCRSHTLPQPRARQRPSRHAAATREISADNGRPCDCRNAPACCSSAGAAAPETRTGSRMLYASNVPPRLSGP